MRVFLRALVNLDPYTLTDDVAEHFAGGNENNQQTAEEILLSTIDGLTDDKLTDFALRLALTGYIDNRFANGDENSQQSNDEIVLAALDGTADEKLTGLALRLVLSDHVAIPHESQPDLLTEAEQVFAPKKPKVVKSKTEISKKPKLTTVKRSPKKEAARKKAA